MMYILLPLIRKISFIILFLFSGLIVFAQNSLEKRATVAVQKECVENVLNIITLTIAANLSKKDDVYIITSN